jgi:hypothetical protein
VISEEPEKCGELLFLIASSLPQSNREPLLLSPELIGEEWPRQSVASQAERGESGVTLVAPTIVVVEVRWLGVKSLGERPLVTLVVEVVLLGQFPSLLPDRRHRRDSQES